MKKQFLYRIAVSVLFLFTGKESATALTSGPMMTVQVPFEFQIHGNQFPAGKYRISRDSQTSGILWIYNVEEKRSMAVQTNARNHSELDGKPCLVFKAFGEERFLAEVRFYSVGTGCELIRSKRESDMERIVAANTLYAYPDAPGNQ